MEYLQKTEHINAKWRHNLLAVPPLYRLPALLHPDCSFFSIFYYYICTWIALIRNALIFLHRFRMIPTEEMDVFGPRRAVEGLPAV